MSHRFCGHLSLGPNRQFPTSIPSFRYKALNRKRIVCWAFVGDGNGLTGSNGHAGLPLSMFTPYKQLPPEGQMVPASDAACDPTVQNCKTLIYTYESQCMSCSGTGFVKSHANGRRASLCTCLLCHGLGYVRRTTSRFVPEMGDPEGIFTMARPEHEPDPGPARNKGKADSH